MDELIRRNLSAGEKCLKPVAYEHFRDDDELLPGKIPDRVVPVFFRIEPIQRVTGEIPTIQALQTQSGPAPATGQ